MRIGGGVSRGGGVGSAMRSSSDVSPANSRIVDGASENKDVVSVSQTAQMVAAAREMIAKIPTVRASKIEAIQSQLNSGAYRPDSEAVAAGLMREYMQLSGY
ncbi:MAG: flagellar biosynthesis anti-sigma factor FlgM [Holophagales bacterium]|jgi:flagellar biosynthesis anti-sigma factor FlgM|nr:flagellar biosynthesis anti-sigma factor FlgM [Holophagales bacterium]